MDSLDSSLCQLQSLHQDIQTFIDTTAQAAQYRAPIIDWHHRDHPHEYGQKDITGLRKFLSTVQAERDYVQGVSLFSVNSRD